MYAVIKAGGHQYKVSAGEQITIDRLAGNVGDRVTFSDVLMIGNQGQTTIGTPTVANARVEATIKGQTRAPKVTIFKYKRTKKYKVTRGHKQPQTVVEINTINA